MQCSPSFNGKVAIFKAVFLAYLFFLLTLSPLVSVSQVNTFKPADSKDGKGGSQSTENNNESNTGANNEIIEGKKLFMQQDLNEANEENLKAMKVNYDSLYSVFLNNKTIAEGESKLVSKYFFNKRISKIYQIDTALFNKIEHVNKLYCKIVYDKSNADEAQLNNINLIQEMAAADARIKTTEIINFMLPPLVIFDAYKLAAKDYEKLVNQFFSKAPELIYLCNKNFIKMLELKQYNKLLKLHLASTNVIDFRMQK